MFKNSLKFTFMYGMNAPLNTTYMYVMSVNNASHRVYMYTQPNHIGSEYK